MTESKMTISQFAARIGVHPATLRGWDKKGILKPAIRSPGGTRYYTEQQVTDYQDRYLTGAVPAGNPDDLQVKATPEVILQLTEAAESAGADPKKFLYELSQRPEILKA